MMGRDEQFALSAEKMAVATRFVEHLKVCHGIMYVGARGIGDSKAEFYTGGISGAGVTPADLANGIGIMVAELATGIVAASKAAGQPATFEQSVRTVIAHVQASALAPRNNAKGTRRVEEAGGEKSN